MNNVSPTNIWQLQFSVQSACRFGANQIRNIYACFHFVFFANTILRMGLNRSQNENVREKMNVAKKLILASVLDVMFTAFASFLMLLPIETIRHSVNMDHIYELTNISM